MAYTTTWNDQDQKSSLDLWNRTWDKKLTVVKDENKRATMNKAYTDIRRQFREKTIVSGKRGLSVGDNHPNPFAYAINQTLYAVKHAKLKLTEEDVKTLEMWESCAMGEYKNFHSRIIRDTLFSFGD